MTRSPHALRSVASRSLYLADLLAETLAVPAARDEVTQAVLDDVRLGDTLRRHVADHLAAPGPGDPGRRRSSPGSPTSRAAGRRRPGLRADGPARLRHRPAAQPAVHARLIGLDRRPGRGDQPGHARPPPRDHPHPTRSTGTIPRFAGTSLRVRAGPGTPRGRRRAAAGAGGARGRRRRAHHGPPAPSGWPGGASPPAWRTPCWSCRSPRNARRCTSTPSARWSTSTRS